MASAQCLESGKETVAEYECLKIFLTQTDNLAILHFDHFGVAEDQKESTDIEATNLDIGV